MLLQNSTLFNNLTQGWETCSLRIPELKTFFFLEIIMFFELKLYQTSLWPTPTFFLDLTVPEILCYAFVSSMPTSLVGLNKTFLF